MEDDRTFCSQIALFFRFVFFLHEHSFFTSSQFQKVCFQNTFGMNHYLQKRNSQFQSTEFLKIFFILERNLILNNFEHVERFQGWYRNYLHAFYKDSLVISVCPVCFLILSLATSISIFISVCMYLQSISFLNHLKVSW